MDCHQKPWEYICLWNIHLVLNGGESLKQPKEPFPRGSVVTSQKEASPLSFKSQRKLSQTSRTEKLIGRRKKIRGFFFQIIRPPSMPCSLISTIKTYFNGIFENYYGLSCYSTVRDSILRPSNSKKKKKKKSPLFPNIVDRFAAASILLQRI